MKNNPTPAPKANYTSPESEVITVKMEVNIMSPGGSIPGLTPDDTPITF